MLTETKDPAKSAAQRRKPKKLGGDKSSQLFYILKPSKASHASIPKSGRQ
ncbi:hypothetical protein B4096_2053 [Heyndrickxia coagulans]|nr:hypothetical protein B4096_2053 [Heyndrickxia coagulans]